MRLPDFFIIGAAKAGTTTLHAILDRHPQVFMPKVKEPEFFARDDRYAQGIESYARHFEAARPDQVVGEASTIYSLSPLFPRTAGRIRQHVPEARIIYVLREPVSRAYSYYAQIIKGYQNRTKDYAVHRSFEEFVLPEAHAKAAPTDQVFSPAYAHLPDTPDLCLAGSDYVHQIETYLERFPQEQMLFLKFEDFVADPIRAFGQITDFIGVDRLSDELVTDRSTTRNVARIHFDRVAESRAAHRLARTLGPLWELREALPWPFRDRMRRVLLAGRGPRDHEPPPMRPETRAMLQARFVASFDRLSELTGLRFDDWARQ